IADRCIHRGVASGYLGTKQGDCSARIHHFAAKEIRIFTKAAAVLQQVRLSLRVGALAGGRTVFCKLRGSWGLSRPICSTSIFVSELVLLPSCAVNSVWSAT